jgi:hypothetical protein
MNFSSQYLLKETMIVTKNNQLKNPNLKSISEEAVTVKAV